MTHETHLHLEPVVIANDRTEAAGIQIDGFGLFNPTTGNIVAVFLTREEAYEFLVKVEAP